MVVPRSGRLRRFSSPWIVCFFFFVAGNVAVGKSDTAHIREGRSRCLFLLDLISTIVPGSFSHISTWVCFGVTKESLDIVRV